MIEQYFPSKRKVYQPPSVVVGNDNYTNGRWDGSKYTEAARAHTRNLTVEEYRNRVKAVAAAIGKCKWFVGQEGFPYSIEGTKEHGKCRVVAIVSHFDNYGNVEWNDPPYLMAISPINQPDSIVNCSVGYLVETDPTLVVEC